MDSGDRKLTSISHSALGHLKTTKIEKGLHSSKHSHRRAGDGTSTGVVGIKGKISKSGSSG